MVTVINQVQITINNNLILTIRTLRHEKTFTLFILTSTRISSNSNLIKNRSLILTVISMEQNIGINLGTSNRLKNNNIGRNQSITITMRKGTHILVVILTASKLSSKSRLSMSSTPSKMKNSWNQIGTNSSKIDINIPLMHKEEPSGKKTTNDMSLNNRVISMNQTGATIR